MKIFLDTANVQELQEVATMGLLDGVTTNPSLIAKEKRPFRDLVDEICRIVDGVVNLEVVATDAAGMVSEGRELAKIAPNVVVKLPTTAEGIKALRILSREGLKTNLTLCFSPTQALLVAKGGATYVSPFLGRLDDIAHVGMDVIRTMRTIFDNYGFKTQILAASLRNPLHVVDAAVAGADVATMPFTVFQMLLKHPLTDIGLKKFLDDWQKAGVHI
ncbi:MAG TPA: fructose-6-phosphate aldolase [Methylomirabilota bacterium]|jgi:transaldolase|nr:fructose-6-phosphate aldolase [Methylomirabilota bacterium]